MNKKIGSARQEQRMLKENLHGARAAYGKQILVTVSRELTAEYGRGFSHAELARMEQFVQLFPEESIVVTLLQQLSWSHLHALLRSRLQQAIAHARESAVRHMLNEGGKP